MGAYINPVDVSKEDWLLHNAAAVPFEAPTSIEVGA